MDAKSTALGASCLFLAASAGSCEYRYPEISVANQIDERVLIRNPAFNGCAWTTTLALGEVTAPNRCLPGDDRVHFQKFDAAKYCEEQAKDGTIAGICPCGDAGVPSTAVDQGLVNAVPLWFNYETVSSQHADYDGFYLFRITPDGIEQDFSIPGPYGH